MAVESKGRSKLNLNVIVEIGRLSAYEGKAKSSNPYAQCLEERNAWDRGWVEAVKQLQENNDPDIPVEHEIDSEVKQ